MSARDEPFHCGLCDGDGQCICRCPTCCDGYGHYHWLGNACDCGTMVADPRHHADVYADGEPWSGTIWTRCSCGWKSSILRRGYTAASDVIDEGEAHLERCRRRRTSRKEATDEGENDE